MPLDTAPALTALSSNCDNLAAGSRQMSVDFAESRIAITMEPPFKRQRLAGSSYPEVDLHTRRAQNDFRLKSIFESIFEKYGRDFDGIGDEIDLRTGEIVVNNGHIQGMTNERDAGGSGYSAKKLGNLDHDGQTLIEYTQEHPEALGSSDEEDADVVEETEASEQSDFVADSLIGDVPDSSHLQQLGEKSRRAVLVPSDDEEDELASSDVEWASQNKDRPGVRESFNLLQDSFPFVDEPAIDPVWRAPPLPSITRLERESERIGLTSVDDMRECSDEERAGISLWAPEIKNRPVRRQGNADSIRGRSLSFECGQENNGDKLLSHSSDSEPDPQQKVRWTQKEDELLIHLKMTTNLSSAAMGPYFPERQCRTIGSHWNYMINRGKANPKVHLPTVPRRRIPLSNCSLSTDPPAPDAKRPDHDAISETQESETIQQQVSGKCTEAASSVQSSSKAGIPVEDQYIISPCQVGGDHQTTVDTSFRIPDGAGTHIEYSMREPFSSAKECGCTVIESVYQVSSNGCCADADHSYGASKPLKIDDDSSSRGKDPVSGPLCEGLSCTSIKAELDSIEAEPFSGGIGSPQIHSQDATLIETLDSPRRGSDSEIQREKSISPTVEDTIQRGESTQPEQLKIQSTKSFLTTPAQSTNHRKSSVSRERNVDTTNENGIRRQIVQVIIPLAPSNQPNSRLPLATTETEDPASTRQLPATVESASAAIDPIVSQQGNLAVRTPTMSPSIATAESQYAAPAASVHDGVRTAPGPEIADSQPESTVPVVATRRPRLGEDATRPIILDDESPPLTMSPSVAPSTEKQLTEAIENIIPEFNLQPLRVTSSIATPARNEIEEATEPDILESGSHTLSKRTSAARSLKKRTKNGTYAKTSSSIWTAIDDYSEDELSYL